MSAHRHPTVRLAEDRVSRRLVWGALLVILVGGGLYSLWAIWLHGKQAAARAIVEAPPRPAPRTLAEVRQTQILTERPELERIRAEREMLSRWGWIDQEQGIVSMPIEEAMELLVRETGTQP